ncbi:hypothetical protein PG985_009581 [Apiospora marii]|uniref:Uncharacterized protein n=1 Tax=Apiospora marii TaxID=335849 RepID=A0ABR1RGU1_9PEZI
MYADMEKEVITVVCGDPSGIAPYAGFLIEYPFDIIRALRQTRRGVRVTLSEPPRFGLIPYSSEADTDVIRCADPTENKAASSHLVHGFYFPRDRNGCGRLQKEMAQLCRLPAFNALDGNSGIDESEITLLPNSGYPEWQECVQKIGYGPGTAAETVSQWYNQMEKDGKSGFTNVDSPPDGIIGDATGEDWYNEPKAGTRDIYVLWAFQHSHRGINKQKYIDNPPTLEFDDETWPPACTTCRSAAYLCDCQSCHCKSCEFDRREVSFWQERG